MKKTYFNWSSGKDSAIALYFILKDPSYDVGHLLTSVNSSVDRVSMHGLRRSLLESQLTQLSIPNSTIDLPEAPSMEDYEEIMNAKILELKAEGFRCAAFGDIFLEDLRKYREDQLSKVGIESCFPLWKRDTKTLMKEFLNLGFKTIVVCIKSELLDESFVGRVIDEEFINDLPDNVDPCGENGEFHTFCFDGPIFKNPIKFSVGEKVYKEYQNPNQDEVHDNKKNMGFWYCDLIPA